MRRRAVVGVLCAVAAATVLPAAVRASVAESWPAPAASAAARVGVAPFVRGPAVQRIMHSRYAAFEGDERIGTTEVTDFRRPDGSRSILVRERLENYGPVLDRFLVITFDAAGHVHSGHWVATSEFSPDFVYTWYFDGRVIRAEWEDSNRGRGHVDVPAKAGDPVFTFWGFAESLILSSFDTRGPDVQHVDAVAVEDNVHMMMTVAIERLGGARIEVPAGAFDATHFRVQRFGDTHHWVDEHDTLLRWTSEEGTYRWELERYPSTTRHEDAGSVVARGRYDVSFVAGGEAGILDWAIERTDDGRLVLTAEERFAQRTSQFRGVLDDSLRWVGSSHTIDWHTPADNAVPEVQHFETFFFRGRFHMLRFRDRAYPYLQSRAVGDGLPFHLIHYPIASAFWLSALAREDDAPQSIDELAILGNFYWGAGVEVQAADAAWLGARDVDLPGGTSRGHAFRLNYRGGWHDSEITYLTDELFVPVDVDLSGFLRYRLVEYHVADGEVLQRR